MKKKNLPIYEQVEITGVAAEGKALVRINDIVTFVPNCVPGDIVDLQITKKKHSFMEAKVLRLVTPSPVRCEARCKHFGVCGGCKWQILPYDEQLKYKQQNIQHYQRREPFGVLMRDNIIGIYLLEQRR
jgi:23S rRNA (uracil1939-C5)-methyltransferase